MLVAFRRFGLHTDSSQRYERGVEFGIADDRHAPCSERSAFAGGDFGPITVAERQALLPKREAIILKQAQVDQLLGYRVAGDLLRMR